MKRIAIIDLGTNTFNLLVVDQTKKGFETIYSTKVGVGLGLGGINENKIAEPAAARALKTLKHYKSKSAEYNVNEVFAFGTSAIRNATNQASFLGQVKGKVGIDVNVISGSREADLIYKGVSLGYRFEEPSVIMDIGGGSTEFIYACEKGVHKAGSFEIGAARIYQKFQFNDPFTEEDCEAIEYYLDGGTGDFFKDVNARVLIGASGSFETFYTLIYDRPYPKNEFVIIEMDEIQRSLKEVALSTLEEREADDRIIPIRKKMAPIAAVKISWIIRKLNIQKLIISPFAMKEGVISEL